MGGRGGRPPFGTGGGGAAANPGLGPGEWPPGGGGRGPCLPGGTLGGAEDGLGRPGRDGGLGLP